jgi:hypothetical protein
LYWDSGRASDTFSPLMFFCLKYLQLADIKSWGHRRCLQSKIRNGKELLPFAGRGAQHLEATHYYAQH